MKNLFLTFKRSLIFIFSLGMCSCSGLPLKKLTEVEPQNIELSLIAGNLNVDKYKTISKIKVYAKKVTGKNKGSEKLTERKLELSEFNLNRQTMSVNEAGQAHFKYWVTDVEGDIDLTNMGLPPQGKTLVEAVSKKAEVLAVKGFPEETIFYLPKIALPPKAVKVGDTWAYKGVWRSLKTGWPFEVNLNLKLSSWVSCGGLRCAHITYSGGVSLPKESPLKGATLDSRVSGEFVYAPIGHQFIWAYSKSLETFLSDKKRVEVKSCTASYQTSPDKEVKAFSKRFKSSCY